ncbi:hypothetical protein Pmani_005037 [Petrolisthes manimaculis]|uniref:Uncharacterized protein n=1 Tax=Petrolisthes manimaculis TaxID=1843537 RepID=A0AAE1UKY8_9EUCA|nr:hypothetical protein Pmani_005037 [Petrolisthes manimaculis]
MDHRPLTKKLSRAVLDLKFMKKTKEKTELQEENEERQQLYQNQLQSLHEGADKIVLLSSYVDCMNFLPPRLSFRGMDPDVEKLNEDKLEGVYKVLKPEKEEVKETNVDVTVEEMAAQYMKRKSEHQYQNPWNNSGTIEEGQGTEEGHGGSFKKKQMNHDNRPRGRGYGQGRGQNRGNNQRGRGSFRERQSYKEDGYSKNYNEAHQQNDGGYQGQRGGGKGPNTHQRNWYSTGNWDGGESNTNNSQNEYEHKNKKRKSDQ